MITCGQIARVRAVALAVAGVSLLMPPRATAQVIITQRPGDDFIAFEAENNARITNPPAGSMNVTYSTRADAGASGGNVLYPNENGFPSTSQLAVGAANAPTATYTLRFLQAGTYTLYYRWRASDDPTVQTGGSEANSFYIPASPTLTDPPTVTSASNGFSTTSTPPSTTYSAVSDLTYTISAADVGVNRTFTIQARETDLFLDRFILSIPAIDVTNRSTIAFDALPNSPVVAVPEPASALLVAVAAAGWAVRRPRPKR
jgi:hypothetical protein